MFSQPRKNDNDAESSQPLLDNSEAAEDRVVFSLEDDDSTVHSGRNSPQHERPERSVRFREEAQVIGPSLKSTMQSRETGACSSS